jgi:competence protein ComFC
MLEYPPESYRSFVRSLPSRVYPQVRNSLFSMIFPWYCPGCTALMRYPASICEKCLSRLKRIEPPFCNRCGAPIPRHWRVQVCPECKLGKSSLSRIRSTFYYEGLVKTMIHEVKYKRAARYLGEFSECLFLALRSEFPTSIQAIVPVPLHKARAWERTFNQAELISRNLSRLSGICVWKGLRKIKITPSQSSLSGAARRSNLKQAFVFVRSEFRPKSVLLVDDIITTGATLEECARTLRKSAGIRTIYALTIARAVQNY